MNDAELQRIIKLSSTKESHEVDVVRWMCIFMTTVKAIDICN